MHNVEKTFKIDPPTQIKWQKFWRRLYKVWYSTFLKIKILNTYSLILFFYDGTKTYVKILFKFICIMNKSKGTHKRKDFSFMNQKSHLHTIFCFLEQYPDINGVKLLSFPASWDHHSCVVSKWDLIFLLSRRIFIVINPNFVAFWVWFIQSIFKQVQKLCFKVHKINDIKIHSRDFLSFL